MPFVILKGISKFATKFRGKKILAYYLLIYRTPPFIYTVGFAFLPGSGAIRPLDGVPWIKNSTVFIIHNIHTLRISPTLSVQPRR